jgi:hypothetical protein
MATLSRITPDMVWDALYKLEVAANKYAVWLGEHIGEIVEIVKDADEDKARQDFLAFCDKSPHTGDLSASCQLVCALKQAAERGGGKSIWID